MVQINYDYYEDLTPESFTRILNDLSLGRTPKPGPQVDRLNSAPIGGQTTLTDPSLYTTNGKSGQQGSALQDSEAKKPGAAANLQEAPAPKPPMADATDPRRS
jgi:NADH-quinone oxidoreductase subunit E